MATRKMKKFDVGGTVNSDRFADNPKMGFRKDVSDLYRQMVKGRREYIGTPEFQNYRNYMHSLPNKGDVIREGLTSGNMQVPTLPAYDPKQTYLRAREAKTQGPGTMTNNGGQGQIMNRAQGMKKGGKVSASKRGDGIAERGKTRGTMR